jgi:tRNA uridine 5-carboxymethylaminomethyl modification enzyme
MKRPEIDYPGLMRVEGIGPGCEDPQVQGQVEVQVKYSGYLDRQSMEIERRLRHENTPIPASFDYDSVSGLSSEVREKLKQARPETIGQASRIPGITPPAISLLLVHLKKRSSGRQVA